MSVAQTPLARLLRAAEPRPAAVHLTPAMLLALQAFDAAYRLGSFRAAAHALHLTPSAISHRIRSLEKLIGESLFTRAHRTVSPTLAGRTLAEATGRAFGELARIAQMGDGHGVQNRLRLAVATTFATSFLIPRVADFMRGNPSIELVIENVAREVDFENEPYDAAINSGSGDWPGLSATELVRIFTMPVCTSALKQRFRLREPADLQRTSLIYVTTYPLAWPLWLERAGLRELKPAQSLWLDSFSASVEAAAEGAGVALGLEPLFAEDENRGRLVRPFSVRQPTGALLANPSPRRRAQSRAPRLQALARPERPSLAGSMNSAHRSSATLLLLCGAAVGN
jgi:DNA-binding transcriptional LysR family regulator